MRVRVHGALVSERVIPVVGRRAGAEEGAVPKSARGSTMQSEPEQLRWRLDDHFAR